MKPSQIGLKLNTAVLIRLTWGLGLLCFTFLAQAAHVLGNVYIDGETILVEAASEQSDRAAFLRFGEKLFELASFDANGSFQAHRVYLDDQGQNAGDEVVFINSDKTTVNMFKRFPQQMAVSLGFKNLGDIECKTNDNAIVQHTLRINAQPNASETVGNCAQMRSVY